MGLTNDEIAFATDLFADIGEITTRKMMGGVCLYSQGTIFAIVHSTGDIMIKGTGAFIDHLEALGCTRWEYTRKDGKQAAMPYWSLPPGAQDDPQEAAALARLALQHL